MLRHRSVPLAALLLALAQPSSGHGGGLDANGCHTNRRTGDYHCHRSAPEARRSSSPAGASSAAPEAAATSRELTLSVELLLAALDFDPGRPDGRPDANTEAASRRFEESIFLEPTGKASGALLVRLAEEVLRKTRGR